nr:MAG TPA: hypothetical protein [Caudoviricetes sp.]
MFSSSFSFIFVSNSSTVILSLPFYFFKKIKRALELPSHSIPVKDWL